MIGTDAKSEQRESSLLWSRKRLRDYSLTSGIKKWIYLHSCLSALLKQ